MDKERDFKRVTTELIKGFISLLEGYKELLRTGFTFSQPGFWATVASENERVVGFMFKAIAIMTTSIQSVPKKIQSATDLEKAINIVENGIDKLRALLAELGGN